MSYNKQKVVLVHLPIPINIAQWLDANQLKFGYNTRNHFIRGIIRDYWRKQNET